MHTLKWEKYIIVDFDVYECCIWEFCWKRERASERAREREREREREKNMNDCLWWVLPPRWTWFLSLLACTHIFLYVFVYVFCMFFYLFMTVFLPVWVYVCFATGLCIFLPVYACFSNYFCMFLICLFVCIFLYLYVCMYVFPSVFLHVFKPVWFLHVSAYVLQSAYVYVFPAVMNVFQSVCLFVFQSVCVYVSFFLCLCIDICVGKNAIFARFIAACVHKIASICQTNFYNSSSIGAHLREIEREMELK